MTAGRVAALAREDLRLTLRDRSSIFWIFIAPFLWVFFFGVLNRPPAKPQIGLTVIQQDDGPIAGRLIESLRAESFDLTVVPPGGRPAGGKEAPPRTLTIPAGFDEAVDQRRKVSLPFAARQGADADATFAAEVALHRAIVRLLGGIALDGFEPAGDAVVVKSEWAGVRTPPTGYYQTIPGNLVMFVLIATVTYGSALLAAERRNGLLKRISASPATPADLLAGKVLGRVAVALVQVAVFVVMSIALFRIGWGRSPLGLALVALAFVVCAAAIGLLGGTLFRSAEAASGIGIVVVLVMSAMGGCWWPAEVMPRWMQTAAYLFPTGWAMNGLHELLSWDGTLRDVLPHAGALALFAAAAIMLAGWRLRRLT